jgi:quercetin dioxygenase-like cupin family protein
MTDRRPPRPDLGRDDPWTSVQLAAEASALGDPMPDAARERAARSLFQTDTLGVVLTNLAAGSTMENEQPDEAATIQGIRGTCRVAIGDESVDLAAGVLVAIAPGLAWRLEATSQASVLVTVARPRT